MGQVKKLAVSIAELFRAIYTPTASSRLSHNTHTHAGSTYVGRNREIGTFPSSAARSFPIDYELSKRMRCIASAEIARYKLKSARGKFLEGDRV